MFGQRPAAGSGYVTEQLAIAVNVFVDLASTNVPVYALFTPSPAESATTLFVRYEPPGWW